MADVRLVLARRARNYKSEREQVERVTTPKAASKEKKKDNIINNIKYNHSLCIGFLKIPFQSNTERRRIVRHKRDKLHPL